MPAMQFYRVSDLLVKHREKIEDALFGRIQDLFGLPVTVTLYDLTNMDFEALPRGTPKPPSAGRRRNDPIARWSGSVWC